MDLPFNTKDKCDVCGTTEGVTEFYGAKVCPKCSNTCAEDCRAESEDVVPEGMFKFVEVTPETFKKKVMCSCRFCKGGEMRKDVRHIKLFMPNGLEYWLHLDLKSGIGDMQEKL